MRYNRGSRLYGDTLILSLVTALAASGATVRVTVGYDADGPHLLGAVQLSDRAPERPGEGLELLDALGRTIGTAAIPDPRIRSIVTPEGGDTARLVRGVSRFTVRWPDDAVRLRLAGRSIAPLPAPPASATLVHDGGPPDERLDLVILGDGYTRNQQDAFGRDVQRTVDHLLSIAPWDRYADLLNIWQVEIPSAQSGIAHAGRPRDTVFDCAYDCADIERLVCCDDEAVVAAVDAAVPDADGILVLVNDPAYGGSGGFTYATASVGPDGVWIAAHELGHSLVGLWDEYSYGVSGDEEGPNCAADPNGSWDAWLPEVGSFPECSFTNLHRPTEADCMMYTLQDGYCPVCRERIVLAMHERLPGLIRATDPPPGILPPETARIGVEVGSDPERLSFAWTLDGELVSSEPELALQCSGLKGTLSLQVTDDTPWVRTDPDARLSDEAGPWTVDAPTCNARGVPRACGCATGGSASGGLLLMLGLAVCRSRHRAEPKPTDRERP